MKNWQTSTAGILGALPLIWDGIMKGDWMQVGSGIGILLMGLLAKDRNVTGGTRPQ